MTWLVTSPASLSLPKMTVSWNPAVVRLVADRDSMFCRSRHEFTTAKEGRLALELGGLT